MIIIQFTKGFVMISRNLVVVFLAIFAMPSALAVLEIKITEGRESALPIAVGKFEVSPNLELGLDNPGEIILSDLIRSGYFKPAAELPKGLASPDGVKRDYWRSKGINYVVVGEVIAQGPSLKVRYFLVDTLNKDASPILRSAEAVVTRTQLRKYAHQISDAIFSLITGKQSSFTSSIAYVLESDTKPKTYSLIYADYDGHNEVVLVKQNKALMSPDISPDKRKIAYVSFENDKSEIYIQDLYTGARTLVSGEKGINSSPVWSPDGKNLAMVLSPNNNVDIYSYNVASKRRTRLTRNKALDTEPFWFDNGQKLVFTSSRGGSPQLYALDIRSGDINRLTFEGRYNVSGSFNQNDNRLLMVHRVESQYQVAIKNLDENVLTVLTQTNNNVAPSFSPDGNMILYQTKSEQKSVLAVMSTDGEYKVTLPSPDGEVRDPIWSR